MRSNRLLFPVLVLALMTGCSGGSSNSSTSTLPAVTLLSIAVTPANPSIAPSTSETFIATGTYSDNTSQNITASATWSSSVTSVATVTNGKATSIAPGQTTITATSGGVSGSTTLTVTSATIASLAVTPVDPIIVVGGTKQFVATGTFSDSTTQDLTSLASWSSSSQTVATISNTAGSNGLVTIARHGDNDDHRHLGRCVRLHAPDGEQRSYREQRAYPHRERLELLGNSYPNKPCVSVTVCSPGTSTCQTISDILLDTGSTGLRIFKSLLTASL